MCWIKTIVDKFQHIHGWDVLKLGVFLWQYKMRGLQQYWNKKKKIGVKVRGTAALLCSYCKEIITCQLAWLISHSTDYKSSTHAKACNYYESKLLTFYILSAPMISKWYAWSPKLVFLHYIDYNLCSSLFCTLCQQYLFKGI